MGDGEQKKLYCPAKTHVFLGQEHRQQMMVIENWKKTHVELVRVGYSPGFGVRVTFQALKFPVLRNLEDVSC